MRILGLDVGDCRTGVALSDELGITAQGLCQIDRRGQPHDLADLEALIAMHQVQRIVVGMPRNMNGTYGSQAQKTEDFIQHLEHVSQRPCVRWDERLTTQQAERLLIAANQRRDKRKAVRDQIAAQLILQNYLDYQRMTTTLPNR
jgi:putative Holliday junction resolvase